jgi:hypothetical protein
MDNSLIKSSDFLDIISRADTNHGLRFAWLKVLMAIDANGGEGQKRDIAAKINSLCKCNVNGEALAGLQEMGLIDAVKSLMFSRRKDNLYIISNKGKCLLASILKIK